MPALWPLILVMSIGITLFIAWMILTSCLGEGARRHISGMSYNPREAIYDSNYMGAITSNGHGTWNQFEMQDMLGDHIEHSDSE
ncbi:uncharacterized protein EAF02_008730 [Botrytis sinoallii]|uniref:Uncharacterized protein n=1 Tax=Botrytis byssoidea TaxID=139641 RepID=A0A9P5IRR0_9HELO|nr:uncharacterized protein EAE97_004862 [Botrytis byssoidea]XP_038755188.1 uncharacterized protein EAF02_008730 [Botrytis sinoallii]KAF7872659.1 hypothetical protein EAF02_008730 [Botrytis sinoallii]KAF7924516.1 hypothetical protein EAE99_006464 [Botrytis elliptica]KAF7945824.1 hypothetical protein EAE97_004862 [Botrytis byssoidea]